MKVQKGLYHISARRWFHKSAGNTYHSVSVMFPDGTVKIEPFKYGYGQAWEQTALEMIAGEIPRHDNGNPIPPYRWFESHGITAVSDVVDVSRRKDLHHDL